MNNSIIIALFEWKRLSRLAVLSAYERWEGLMWQCLVPVGNASDIVLALEQTAVADPDLLNGHANVLLKTYGILNMPPIEPALRHGIVVVVWIVHELVVRGIVGVSEVRRAVGLYALRQT